MTSIKPPNAAGFSLLELLIYTAVSSVLILVVTQGLLSLHRGRGQTQARTEVHANLRFAIDKIAYDLQSASSVSVPAFAGEVSSALSLISASGSLIEHCLLNGVLYRQTGAPCTGSSPAVSGSAVKVEALSFRRIENANAVLSKTFTSIEVTLTMRYKSASPDFQYARTSKTTVSLQS